MATDPGYEQPKKSNALWWILGIIALLLILVCGGGLLFCGGAAWLGFSQVGKWEQRVIDEEGTSVEAAELSRNPASYQDKVVKVHGTVKSKTADNEIILSGSPGGPDIKCQAGLKQLMVFSSVNAGDTVTVKGLVQGNVLGYVNVAACQSVTKGLGDEKK
jgi:hypothetical protein